MSRTDRLRISRPSALNTSTLACAWSGSSNPGTPARNRLPARSLHAHPWHHRHARRRRRPCLASACPWPRSSTEPRRARLPHGLGRHAPDYVSPTVTPRLHDLATRGVWFERSHAVYPTLTRANSPGHLAPAAALAAPACLATLLPARPRLDRLLQLRAMPPICANSPKPMVDRFCSSIPWPTAFIATVAKRSSSAPARPAARSCSIRAPPSAATS